MSRDRQARSSRMRRVFRLANMRLLSQIFFFALFLLACWASWTTRLGGYPVSRFLELDPLVLLATALSTGYVYRALGWGLLVFAVTLIFGRVFCNWICPYGSLHHFVGWLFSILPRKERWEANRYRKLFTLKYGLLAALLLMACFGVLQIGLLDPICLMYRSVILAVAPSSDRLFASMGIDGAALDFLRFAPGSASRVFIASFGVGAILLGFLALNLYIPRFFCRVLCPLGALLGTSSRFALFRIHRNLQRCTDCNLCLSHCEGAADPQGVLRLSECFACMNCLDDCPEDALSFRILGQDYEEVRAGTDVGRRRLVFSGILGAVAVPLLRTQGVNTDENYSPLLIRPPGSVEESDFLGKCIKCDQCVGVCPTNVLQGATFAEGGLEALWTPVMNFHLGHCQLKCTLCSEVCPTGAIRRITVEEKLGVGAFEEQGPVRLGTAFYDLGRCLPHAMEIPCVVCEEVCPTSPKAIQTHDEEIMDAFGQIVVLRKPFIVPDLCIGCGLCEKECPVTDRRAVYVTPVGESRSTGRRLLLSNRVTSE